MFGAMAVKHMAIEANINPPKKAKTGTNRTSGLPIKGGLKNRLKTPITANTIIELIADRVAPQTSSPAITSSTLTGVAIIASNVFW